MKNVIRLFSLTAILLFAGNVFAQDEPSWPEMENFHTIMSQTWHPIESGNFEPIRTRSAELAEAAAAWKKTAIPTEFKAVKDIKKLLKELASETKELNKEIVKGISDEEIKKEMAELHDIFHKIVGLCKE